MLKAMFWVACMFVAVPLVGAGFDMSWNTYSQPSLNVGDRILRSEPITILHQYDEHEIGVG